MDILQAIESRRSTQLFHPEEVDEALLNKILTYGTWAPSHYMQEAWNFKLYQSAGKHHLIEAILASYRRIGLLKQTNDPKAKQMADAIGSFLWEVPHHLLIYLPRQSDPIRYEEDYASVCAFIQNIQLAAWNEGVGMLWTIAPYLHDADFYRDVGLNEQDVKIAAVMQIGYPKLTSRKKARTAIQEKMTIIRD